jgi:hypothetical protein
MTLEFLQLTARQCHHSIFISHSNHIDQQIITASTAVGVGIETITALDLSANYFILHPDLFSEITSALAFVRILLTFG